VDALARNQWTDWPGIRNQKDRDLYEGISGETSLRRVLKKACGIYTRKIGDKVYQIKPDEHLIQYFKLRMDPKGPKVPDGEPHIIKLPGPLLKDANLRKRVAKTFDANKKKGMPAGHQYLLSGKIFCGTCNSGLGPEASRAGKLFYRHRWKLRRASAPGGVTKIDCAKPFTSIPARDIEWTVFWKLYDAFGDVKRMEEAERAAFPDDSQREALEKRIAKKQKELAKADGTLERYFKDYEAGRLSGPKVQERINSLDAEGKRLQAEIGSLTAQIVALPSSEEVRTAAGEARKAIDLLKKKYKSLSHGKTMHRVKFGPEDLRWMPAAKYLFDTCLEKVTVKPTKSGFEFTLSGALNTEEKGTVIPVLQEYERRQVPGVFQ
jgi:hypothetical protein